MSLTSSTLSKIAQLATNKGALKSVRNRVTSLKGSGVINTAGKLIKKVGPTLAAAAGTVILYETFESLGAKPDAPLPENSVDTKRIRETILDKMNTIPGGERVYNKVMDIENPSHRPSTMDVDNETTALVDQLYGEHILGVQPATESQILWYVVAAGCGFLTPIMLKMISSIQRGR